MSTSLKILTLCTGNVARSVMLGYMLTALADASGENWQVRTAGTHAIEGSSMSGRTRDALLRIGELGSPNFGAHRSHQITAADVIWADVILASEADHVRYVENNFVDYANKTVQLAQFVVSAPLDGPFGDQLAAVASLTPLKEFDIVDPAGGDAQVYNACAQQLWRLSQVFAMLVDQSSS